MALISRKDFKWGDDLVTSRTALERIRIELLKRYPNTPVHTDVHAIVVPFSQGASVDVVPAVFEGMLPNNWPLYHIPDGAGVGCLPAQNCIINLSGRPTFGVVANFVASRSL